MGSMLTEWVNESEQNMQLLAEEELILSVTEQIWELLENKQLTKSDLANKMGRSRAYVSQVLSGSRNMTLRTLADVAFALGETVTLSIGKATSVTSSAQWEKGSSPVLLTNVIDFPSVSIDASNGSWYGQKLRVVR